MSKPLRGPGGGYAQAMGMPGTFAHGMLAMALAGIPLTNCVGMESLADYRARFRTIVWPGDTLTSRVTLVGVVERDDHTLARLDIVARNQTEEAVLTGRAHAFFG